MARYQSIQKSFNGFLVCATIGLVSPSLLAGEDVISDDGREVRLKNDGTWDFRSNDRYANTKDGQRIRLKSDNTWEYVGNAPMETDVQFRDVSTDIKLRQVVFESFKEKAHKNTRKKTHTVFYLSTEVSAAAAAPVKVRQDNLALFNVSDSNGNEYPVLSVEPKLTELAPGSKQEFVIRADGSPQWWGVKSIQLKLSPEIFGSAEFIVLNESVHEIKKKNVEGFE